MSKLIFLGTGTSSGVPVLGCNCATCISKDPRDKRFRTSAYIVTAHGSKILIDVSPDFRLQALRHKIYWLDGILITHSHHDHIGGLDELRQLNFLMKQHLAVYCDTLTLREIQARFNYIFKETQKGGGKPQLTLHHIEARQQFSINEQQILPFEVFHGRIAILGYKIGSLSYVTDASYLTSATTKLLENTEVLVINTLRFRPHSTHFCLGETLAMIERIRPQRAYLVHMTHDIKHADVEKILPDNVHLAYDNLEIEW